MKRLPLSLILVILFSAILLGQTAPAPEEVPSRLATVNLVYIFDHLDEKRSGQDVFDKMTKEYNDQRSKLESEIDKLDKSLKSNLLTPGSAEYLKMQDDLLRKASELKSYLEYAQAKLAIEQRTRTAELYKHINQAIEQYSKANGIALVFVTDDGDFGDAKTVQEILLRANSRKLVYAHPKYDITKWIVEKMNTDYMTRPAGK